MKTIPFAKVKIEVEKIFPNLNIKNRDLLPDMIHNLALQSNITLNWIKLGWWTEYEYGTIDYDDDL